MVKNHTNVNTVGDTSDSGVNIFFSLNYIITDVEDVGLVMSIYNFAIFL